MFELIMTFCVSGQPCAVETLAIFPQEEVGETLCEIARPAIGDAIRAKTAAGTVVTLSCDPSAFPQVPNYSPQKRDNRVTMAEQEKVSPADIALELIDKLAR